MSVYCKKLLRYKDAKERKESVLHLAVVKVALHNGV
jgi:hypothetical protein